MIKARITWKPYDQIARTQSPDWSELLQEARDSFSVEIAGLVFFLSACGAAEPALGESLAGKHARLGGISFLVTLLVLGLVMMLRRRSGYWSAEALVGAEVVLLCGMALTYLWRTRPSTGRPGSKAMMAVWLGGPRAACLPQAWDAGLRLS